MEIKVSKNTVICREGDEDRSLYFITSGKFLICSRSQKMVTPLAYLQQGEFLGEMSFFDELPRSADVIAIEDSSYIKIPPIELDKEFPPWLLQVSKNLTKTLRLYDDVISKNGIKRTQGQAIKPLSHDEQQFYYKILST